MTYGRRRTRHGTEVCFMGRRSRDRARSDLGPEDYCRIADWLDAYLVMGGEGEVITAAKHRKLLKFLGSCMTSFTFIHTADILLDRASAGSRAATRKPQS